MCGNLFDRLLVSCCAAGETNYVMDLIKTYDEQAKAKNVRIVPCCGYDSIPSGKRNKTLSHNSAA